MAAPQALQVRTCLSPSLMPHFKVQEAVVVVIDILRATTSMCVALDRGVNKIYPVEKVEEAQAYKDAGMLAAAERNGLPVAGFDFGNSPLSFLSAQLNGQSLAMTTTNGTHAIHAARAAHAVVIGAFANYSVLLAWLLAQQRTILLLCAGWKQHVNLEDTLFAGALAEGLCTQGTYQPSDDATTLARTFAKAALQHKAHYLRSSSHAQRLLELHLQQDVKYCLRQDTHPVVPILQGNALVNGLTEA